MNRPRLPHSRALLPLLVAVASLLAVTGCATASREKKAESRGFERGYRQAVKSQYWIIQNQQRQPSSAQTLPPDNINPLTP
ncbi:hypothetical protein OPIT5_22145 [Opitutaceae bacterium TAV5]|nr:hypothetical protein OPIT5_22145 [Opitutaceae bacterium TAV5]